MSPAEKAAADVSAHYRSVLGQLPKGVTVLSTQAEHGPVGTTATAVSSLSLRPPLILACLRQESRTLHWLRRHGGFAVNLLRDRDSAISMRFADPHRTGAAFNGVCYRLEGGVPVLTDALAWLVCDLHTEHDGGDHVIVVGSLVSSGYADGEPLVWHRGSYRTVADPAPP